MSTFLFSREPARGLSSDPLRSRGPPPDPPPIRRDPRAVLRLMVQSGGGSLYQQEGEGGPVLDS